MESPTWNRIQTGRGANANPRFFGSPAVSGLLSADHVRNRLPWRSGGPPAVGATKPQTICCLPSGPPRTTPVPGVKSSSRTMSSRGPNSGAGRFQVAISGVFGAASVWASRTLPSAPFSTAVAAGPSQARSAGRQAVVAGGGSGGGGGETDRTSSIPPMVIAPSKSTSSGDTGSGTSTSRTSPRVNTSSPSV